MSGTAWTRAPAIEIANRFLDSAPVDLIGMARAMSIGVDMNAPLLPNMSGKIVCCDMAWGKYYAISVNGAHSENRKRFTLAHEIAHFILHKDLMRGGITDNEMYRSGLSDQVEFEANRLAAELLMPATLVRSFWQTGMRSVVQLASKFGASEEAMRIRLKQLGYGV